MRLLIMLILLGAACSLAPGQAQGESTGVTIVRLRNISNLCGVQDNHLSGVGVVVGLRGTGDSNKATMTKVANVLAGANINIDAGQLANGGAALVMVTCEIPPFMALGSRIDLHVQTTQDAQSLFGGQLLFTTLRHPGAGEKGGVYVVGQGPVSIGGFSANSGASNIIRNHPTAGLVTNGGIVEKEIPMKLVDEEGHLGIRLHQPSAFTVKSICDSLRTIPGLENAQPVGPGKIQIKLDPLQQKKSNLIPLISRIQDLPVQVKGRSEIRINEKTGTIIVGPGIKVSTVTILKGNLTVTVSNTQVASQPPGFSPGETRILDRTSIDVVEGKDQLLKLKGGAYLSDVVAMMNRMGASTRDIISILEQLRDMGAIHAQIKML